MHRDLCDIIILLNYCGVSTYDTAVNLTSELNHHSRNTINANDNTRVIKCFSFCDFICRSERKSGDARIYRIPFHSVLQSPPTFGRADLFGSPSVLLRALIRTDVRRRRSVNSSFTSFRFTCGFLVECVIINICAIFFWISCNFNVGKIHRFIYKVGTLCFANSNKIGCIGNVACPVFISIKGPFVWRFFSLKCIIVHWRLDTAAGLFL